DERGSRKLILTMSIQRAALACTIRASSWNSTGVALITDPRIACCADAARLSTAGSRALDEEAALHDPITPPDSTAPDAFVSLGMARSHRQVSGAHPRQRDMRTPPEPE